MTMRWLIALCLGVAVVLPNTAAFAQSDAKSLEKQLAAKRKELKAVANDRRKIDSQRGGAVKELRNVEEKVGTTARELAMTEQQIGKETAHLQKLGVQQQALKSTLGGQVQEREKLLRAAYVQNRSGPLKTLLSQDTVAKSQRNLTYHRYLQQDRRTRIRGLNQQLSGLDTVQREINGRKVTLARNQQLQQQQAAQLARDRAERAKIVSGLNKKYATAAAREKAVGKDVAGLNRLLKQLRDAAARAEAERRAIAKQRAAEEAAARREQQRVAKAAAKSGDVGSSSSGKRDDDDAPVRKPQVIGSSKSTVASTGPAVGGVGWPANGALLAGFGATMPDGRKSQGLLIGAGRGTPVRAVAAGEVVYAQWMTGYGQLLIIDHGGGRMSLYAYNEALLKSVGDRVNRGDTVATVGASGGQGRPALYFELRSNGAPINPRSMMQ